MQIAAPRTYVTGDCLGVTPCLRPFDYAQGRQAQSLTAVRAQLVTTWRSDLSSEAYGEGGRRKTEGKAGRIMRPDRRRQFACRDDLSGRSCKAKTEADRRRRAGSQLVLRSEIFRGVVLPRSCRIFFEIRESVVYWCFGVSRKDLGTGEGCCVPLFGRAFCILTVRGGRAWIL